MNVRCRSKLLRGAVEFYARHLLSAQMMRYITIDIKLSRSLAVDGFSSPHEDDEKMRHFVVELNSALAQEQQLLTLAHEMIHVRQYVTKQLSACGTKWMGKKYHIDSYDDAPWEIEAFQQEQRLFEIYSRSR